MKATVLNSIGAPLVVEDVADPVLGTGEVIVDIAATRFDVEHMAIGGVCSDC
jgi:D-arabinose 1-dehydrogenase-like Zn-dependent alcohol dehydrogenase